MPTRWNFRLFSPTANTNWKEKGTYFSWFINRSQSRLFRVNPITTNTDNSIGVTRIEKQMHTYSSLSAMMESGAKYLKAAKPAKQFGKWPSTVRSLPALDDKPINLPDEVLQLEPVWNDRRGIYVLYNHVQADPLLSSDRSREKHPPLDTRHPCRR